MHAATVADKEREKGGGDIVLNSWNSFHFCVTEDSEIRSNHFFKNNLRLYSSIPLNGKIRRTRGCRLQFPSFTVHGEMSKINFVIKSIEISLVHFIRQRKGYTYSFFA